MDDNKIISFEDRKQKTGIHYKEDALSGIFKKDFREQADLLKWYLFHRNVNKYKLFVHCLFYENHKNELPRRKQRGIVKSIERPKGRGIKPRLHNKKS